jgi:hypothetical protein
VDVRWAVCELAILICVPDLPLGNRHCYYTFDCLSLDENPQILSSPLEFCTLRVRLTVTGDPWALLQTFFFLQVIH